MLAFPPPDPNEEKKKREAAEEVPEEQHLLNHVWASSPCRALPTPATRFITLT